MATLKHVRTQSCGCLNRHLRPFEDIYRALLRGARARDITCDLAYEQFVAFTATKQCHYCGDPLRWIEYNGENHNIDRIDSAQGYRTTNCVACCGTCNYMKNAMGYDKFVARICQMASHLGEACTTP